MSKRSNPLPKYLKIPHCGISYHILGVCNIRGVGGFSERGRGVLHLGICKRGCCGVQLLEVLDGIAPAPLGPEDWWLPQRVQSTYMVQSMVSVVVLSLMVWVSIPPMGTWDPLGSDPKITLI